MQTVGERLRYLRNSKKLTIDKLIELINNKYDAKINKGMISKWENNISEPSLDNARIMADFFNISLDYIVGVASEIDSSNKDSDTNNDNLSYLHDDEILSIAAHRSGHEGELTEEELDRIKLAIRVALAKNNK